VNIWPLINLARSGAWLTPSQAATMTLASTIPLPTTDKRRAVSCRKALEKGRRAVDISDGRRGRVARWRSFQTGEASDSGELLYRFRPVADTSGRMLSYCFVWCVQRPGNFRFVPAPRPKSPVPRHDGSYPVSQAAHRGLRVTVRDVVLNADASEWVFLVDLRNERISPRAGGGLGIRSVGYRLGDRGAEGGCLNHGIRIRSDTHDINMLDSAIRGKAPLAVLPAGWTYHYVCVAIPAVRWSDMPSGPLREIELTVSADGGACVCMPLPFRVFGRPRTPRLVHRADGYFIK